MENDLPQIEIASLDEILPDENNANRGTPRGRKMIRNSLKKFGAGRSILLDSDNTVISGNKTLSAAKAQGYKRVQIVDADGDTLIAVRRRDLSLKRDKKARELAIAENRTAEVDLAWDADVLAQANVDLSEMFEPIELDALLNEGKGIKRPERIEDQPPPALMWILLGIPFNRFDLVQKHVAALEDVAEISVQQARNE